MLFEKSKQMFNKEVLHNQVNSRILAQVLVLDERKLNHHLVIGERVLLTTKSQPQNLVKPKGFARKSEHAVLDFMLKMRFSDIISLPHEYKLIVLK